MAKELPPIPAQMQGEWQAWQDLHQEFTKLTGIPINSERCNTLVARIRIWGEELYRLRRLQTHGEHNAAEVIARELGRVQQ